MVATAASLDSIRICSWCEAPGDDQWGQGYAGSGATCSRCNTYREDVLVYLPAADDPRLHMEAGMTGVEFSTCLDLDVRIIWDANGYYHCLGIHPKATKREIREAYQARNGHLSDYMTHAVKQLLNDEVRALYDSVALGDTFFDRYVAEHVRRQAADDIAMSNLTGTSEGTPIELDLEHLMQKPFQVVDTGDRARQDGVSQAPGTTGWGYYRWRSRSTDTSALARWRGLLASALREKGWSGQLAVGFTGGHGAPAVDIKRIGFRWVVFLNDRTRPNEATASAVASRVVSIIPTNRG